MHGRNGRDADGLRASARRWLKAAASAAVGVVLAVGASPAMAQQQAGGDGRALDANQRVGSGGVNDQRAYPDYRVGNDVVTGNVGGGRAFRDTVDYGAPGEFRDTVGADDLFQFRRDAYSSYQPAGLPRGTFDVGSVYRPYTSPQVARPLSRPGQVSTWTIDDRGPMGDVTGRGAFDYLDGRARPFDDRVDRFDRDGLETMDGRWLEVSASPLLGVRSDVRGRPGVVQPGQYDRWLDVPGEPAPEDMLYQREEDVEVDRSLRQSNLLDLRAYQLSAGVGTMEEDRYRSSRSAPTLLLGQQLRSQVLSPERADRAAEQRMSRLEEQVFRPLQSVRSVEPGEDPYMDVLNRMRGQAGEEAGVRGGGQREGGGEADEAEAGDDPFARPGGEMGADEDGAGEGEGAGAGEQQTRAERLLDRLTYDMEPLTSLAGTADNARNRSMRQAEQLFTAGQFFEAEAAYREMTVREAEAPLARVGMAHAQLGAGMIRSAGENLRTLFERHPELIAARYGAPLLPPAERLDWLHAELRRMIDQPRQAAGEAGLVLAYLGYQQGDRAALEEGLDALDARGEQDGLTAVLRHIWLEEPPADGR